MSPWVMAALFLVLLGMKVPVAFALLIPSLGYLVIGDANASAALLQVVGGLDAFALLAIPLFILLGNLAEASGLANSWFKLADAILWPLRASLGYVNIAVSFIFSWMSGAALADAAGIAKVEIPAMLERGYSPRFAAGVSAASSLIGPIMPPSIIAVIYAVSAGVSLGSLLLAGVLPACLMALLLAGGVYLYGRRHSELRSVRGDRGDLRRAALAALPSLLTPVILVGGIISGVFTPTEAGGVAAGYVLLIALVGRKLTVVSLARVFVSAAETTGSLLLIVGSASLFGWIFAFERAPQAIAALVIGHVDSPVLFLLMVNLLLLVVGMLLEGASAILILVPVLLPLANSFGIDPVHFGTMMILNLTIGLITPPIGLVLYVISSVSGIPFRQVAGGSLPWLIPLVAVLAVVAYVPWVTLWLPHRFGL